MINTPAAFAQTPLARFADPVNLQVGVAIGDTLRIVTQYPIDTGSLLPYDDSSHIQSLLILPKEQYDSLPDSLLWRSNRSQAYSLDNDTTLNVACGTFDYGTEYVAIIENLRIVNGSDTLAVPDTISITFTAAQEVYHVLGTSIADSGTGIRCGDTLRVYFDRPLDSAQTTEGPLVEIAEEVPTADTALFGDTTVRYANMDTNIASTSWLDPSDSSIVCVKTADLEPGGLYELKEMICRLTGDSLQNNAHPFVVKSVGSIFLSQSGILDSSFLNQGIFSAFALHPGDTGLWVVPSTVDSFEFSHWSAPGLPGINGSLSDTLQLTQDCSTLQDMSISAVYLPLPVDTLRIDSLSPVRADSVLVYAWDTVLLGAASMPTSFPVRRYTRILLRAHAGTGYSFDHWNSNSSDINGSRQSTVPILINGGVWATPIYVGNFPTGVYELCGDVTSTDIPLLPYLAAVAELTAPVVGLSGCYPTSPTPANGLVTLSILDPLDVGLWQTRVTVDGAETGDPVTPRYVQNIGTGTSGTYDYSDATRTTVEYDVRRFDVGLSVNVRMEDGSQPPASLGVVVNGVTNETGDASVFATCTNSLNGSPESPTGTSFIPWTTGFPDGNGENIGFKAGVTIKLQAEAGDGYEFVGWTTGSPYSDPGGDPSNSNWGEMTIHGDGTLVEVEAVFRRKFRLQLIAVSEDQQYIGTPEPVGFYPDLDDQVIGSSPWLDPEREIFQDATSGILTISLYFSDKVDATSLSGMNAYIEDLTPRIDLKPRLIYDLESPNYTISPDGKEVTWEVLDKPHSYANWDDGSLIANAEASGGIFDATVPKLEQFRIITTTGIQSTTGTPLENPGQYEGEMTYPNVTWTVGNVLVTNFDESWGCGFWGCLHPDHVADGVYNATSGGYAAVDNSGGPITAGKSYVTIPPNRYSIASGTSHTFNDSIIQIWRPRQASVIFGTCSTFESDGADDVYLNLITSGLTDIKSTAAGWASKAVGKLSDGFGNGGLSGALSELGELNFGDYTGLMLDILSQMQSLFVNSDDQIGTNHWEATYEDWWGAKPGFTSTVSNSAGSSGTATVTLQVQLR